VRARAHFEDFDDRGGQAIIVTELPYQVNKARLLERIAELVRNKQIDGISELRDESDKDGMRVVIELKRGEVAEIVLNNLYAQTPMETVFGINMVALLDGQPKLMSLREMLDAFLRHRREVVTRRTIFELRRARERAHMLEGLAVALANIDEVIALIKASPTPAEARARCWRAAGRRVRCRRCWSAAAPPRPGRMDWPGVRPGRRGLSIERAQAQAILDMRLNRLTGLEQGKIVEEFQGLLARSATCRISWRCRRD
jgi:DNA gyrase subunit A